MRSDGNDTAEGDNFYEASERIVSLSRRGGGEWSGQAGHWASRPGLSALPGGLSSRHAAFSASLPRSAPDVLPNARVGENKAFGRNVAISASDNHELEGREKQEVTGDFV